MVQHSVGYYSSTAHTGAPTGGTVSVLPLLYFLIVFIYSFINKTAIIWLQYRYLWIMNESVKHKIECSM